jgi:hypothetical protein
MGLRSDGQLAISGTPAYNSVPMPPPPPGKVYVAIAASHYQMMAIYGDAPPPALYCTAKTNALGCTPLLSSRGIPSATDFEGFHIQAWQLRNHKAGMLIYGVNGRAALPFAGGTLCIGAPLLTTPVANSRGRLRPAVDCSGFYSIDMNAFASGSLGGAPLAALRTPGTTVNCPYWGRDQGFAPPDNSTLTNAIEYITGF